MAIPILCFVRRSNSGKTTLIERLIPELVQAGYQVATIKHAGHGFDLDTEGKDSWRHKRAGASAVMVLSKGSLALFSNVSDEIKVEELRDRFLDRSIDLIIAEGWKSKGYPQDRRRARSNQRSAGVPGRLARRGIGQADRPPGALPEPGRCSRGC